MNELIDLWRRAVVVCSVLLFHGGGCCLLCFCGVCSARYGFLRALQSLQSPLRRNRSRTCCRAVMFLFTLVSVVVGLLRLIVLRVVVDGVFILCKRCFCDLLLSYSCGVYCSRGVRCVGHARLLSPLRRNRSRTCCLAVMFLVSPLCVLFVGLWLVTGTLKRRDGCFLRLGCEWVSLDGARWLPSSKVGLWCLVWTGMVMSSKSKARSGGPFLFLVSCCCSPRGLVAVFVFVAVFFFPGYCIVGRGGGPVSLPGTFLLACPLRVEAYLLCGQPAVSLRGWSAVLGG